MHFHAPPLHVRRCSTDVVHFRFACGAHLPLVSNLHNLFGGRRARVPCRLLPRHFIPSPFGRDFCSPPPSTSLTRSLLFMNIQLSSSIKRSDPPSTNNDHISKLRASAMTHDTDGAIPTFRNFSLRATDPLPADPTEKSWPFRFS
jgi:hypothetical protein